MTYVINVHNMLYVNVLIHLAPYCGLNFLLDETDLFLGLVILVLLSFLLDLRLIDHETDYRKFIDSILKKDNKLNVNL